MPLIFEPDDVNQAETIMLTDGRRVPVADLDEADLVAASRQLWLLRSAYAEAFIAANPRHARDVVDDGDLEQRAPLHQAIARRQAKADASKARPPGSVPADDLFQSSQWTSRDGTTRAVTLLSPGHRRSLLAWLERHAGELADRIDPLRQRIAHQDADLWIRATPLHRRLTELVAGQSGLEEAKDRARQIARRVHFEATGEWPDEGLVTPPA